MRVNLLHAHGSPTRYLSLHKGCRCTICRAATAENNRRYQESHRVETAARGRRYRAEHREETAERNRRYHADHREEEAEYLRRYCAEHLEEAAAHQRRYYAEHPEKAKARVSRYRAEHPEEAAERNRRYRAEHPEMRATNSRNYRARKRNALGTHTAADVRAQHERQRGCCYWCRVKVLWRKKHVDHVVPLILGGSNGPENIVITCPTCNLTKNAQHPMDFAGVLL